MTTTTCNHRRRCARQIDETRIGIFCMTCGQRIDTVDIVAIPEVVELPEPLEDVPA